MRFEWHAEQSACTARGRQEGRHLSIVVPHSDQLPPNPSGYSYTSPEGDAVACGDQSDDGKEASKGICDSVSALLGLVHALHKRQMLAYTLTVRRSPQAVTM
eukprot:scaffold193631_cov32-Tisochrysis_lutea.AAC.2